MNNKKKILVVDDERDICRALQFLLIAEGYEVSVALSGENAIQQMRKSDFDIVITDLKMPGVDGTAVLEEAKKHNPDAPVILMTAYASVESAVDAMKKGASDYIVKPFINEEIRLTVRRLLEQARLSSENMALKQELSRHRGRCKEFVFSSDSMQKIFELLENVIPTKSNILLLGESGTGKGLVAEIIHCSSPRTDKPFISINCSAIPENLLESELFGYKKGAFTGAVADKKGLISMADGGTLFLDEIGDMSLQLQSKLLKVLESGEVMPLGDTKPKYSDIRLVSATNKDIEKIIKEGRFREDLYYRINVVEVNLPPLRSRKDDITLLADMFLRRYANQIKKDVQGIDDEAMTALMSYPWPGNVRELGNVIERAVVVSNGKILSSNDLPDKIRTRPQTKSTLLKDILVEQERNIISKTLEEHRNNKEETAAALGIDLATLYRKLKKFEIENY